MTTVRIAKLLCALPMVLLLAACASEQSKEQPKQSSPVPIPAPRPVPEPRPVVQPTLPENPLHDPASVLAKRSVYYAFDNSDVTVEYRPLVEAHAKYLREHPGATVTIQGNTDERGSR